MSYIARKKATNGATALSNRIDNRNTSPSRKIFAAKRKDELCHSLLAANFDRSSITRIRLSLTAEHTKPADTKKEETTLTETEAAEYLGITRSYLYKLMM